MALTVTATVQTHTTICKVLGMSDPVVIVECTYTSTWRQIEINVSKPKLVKKYLGLTVTAGEVSQGDRWRVVLTSFWCLGACWSLWRSSMYICTYLTLLLLLLLLLLLFMLHSSHHVIIPTLLVILSIFSAPSGCKNKIAFQVALKRLHLPCI